MLIPTFTLSAVQGNKEITVSSDDLNKGTVILYSYPKDMTSGCTLEAQTFQCHEEEFNHLGVKIFGISKDSSSSHLKFADKNSLQFSLISDEEVTLLPQLQMWGRKKFMGRAYYGIIRTTIVFQDGKEIKRWSDVKVKNHVEEVLEFCKSIMV